ncbi:hypothetical protein 7t3_0327 [Salmonella phage 7t3]|nr:hypothetical protein 7t3_0327 [Salmonella phage 7t3]
MYTFLDLDQGTNRGIGDIIIVYYLNKSPQ